MSPVLAARVSRGSRYLINFQIFYEILNNLVFEVSKLTLWPWLILDLLLCQFYDTRKGGHSTSN